MFGTDLTRRVTADVNQPLPDLGEGAALRLNVMVNQNGIADRDVAQYNRFGIAPALVLGLGTPTRLTFTYLHQTEYDHPDYGLPWLYSAPARHRHGDRAAAAAVADAEQLLRLRERQFSAHQCRCADGQDRARFQRHVHGHRPAPLRPLLPAVQHHRAADLHSGERAEARRDRNTAAAAAGHAADSLIISRNQLVGSSLETFLANQLDATTRFNTGFIDHTLRAGIEVGRETSDPIRYTTIGPYSLTPLLFPNPADTYNASIYQSTDTTTTATTQAVYGLDTIKFNEQWQLMGGLRYDRFEAHFGQVTFPNPVTGANASPDGASSTRSTAW